MFKDIYKAQLDEYEKFWKRENKGRVTLNAVAPKKRDPFRNYTDLNEKWLSEEYHYQHYKHSEANSHYIAEGIPNLFTNLGPGCLAACIGGSYELAPNTVWFDRNPIIDDWENPPEIKLDTESEMWKHLTRLQKRYAEDPDVCFSITDLGGIMDVVASLRGSENLLYDLYDYPDEVKEFTARVTELWFKSFDAQLAAVNAAGLPCNSWMNIPSYEPWYPLQCDFCAMISPSQFEEFILPHIVQQVEYMPRSIYHLDGQGELPHLDMLLDIPGLTGIQWTPGAGQAELWDEKWFPIYKKIQDKKKNLVLLGGINQSDMAGMERLIKTLDPTGVFISAWFSDIATGEDILEKIEKWSH
ncbi:MAG: hypothetical protein IJY04_04395 [Clostridia bacterium]|nr:hypothetical protein [Clostridia bacterium]